MTDLDQAVALASDEVAAESATSRKSPIGFWIAVVVVIIIVAAAVIGQFGWFIKDPKKVALGPPLEGPTKDFWFGTDALGRDVFAQTVSGARISVFFGLIATAVGMFFGGLLGLLAGYFRGWVDAIISGIINITLSIPALILVIFIVTVRNPEDRSSTQVLIALCILAIPGLARVVRSATLQYADREFVQAATVMGAKPFRILFREVLPNVVPTMLSFAFLVTGIIIVAESTLSFLGLGVPAQTVTWGSIITNGRNTFAEAPHTVFAPSAILFATVLSLNFIGDYIQKRMEIRGSSL